jgi:CelD/BcsL family acetyltransferase involved in cellulose biosynthesis
MASLLPEAFEAEDLACRVEPVGQAPYIPLPDTWQQYLGALSKTRRSFLTRSLRSFERWARGGTELHHAATPSELEEGKRILTALHQMRWAGQGRGGAFRSPRFRAFHDILMGRLLEAEALELMWLTVGGEPVSAFYGVVWNQKLYYYQSGRRTDLPGFVRPGIVLLAHAIRRAIENGRREFDFLPGPENYKSRLSLAARPIVEIRAVRASCRENARTFTEAVARRVKFRW